MIQTNYLILLTETERSMVEEALTHMAENPFSGVHLKPKMSEKYKKEILHILKDIKKFTGGIRKTIKYYELNFICDALWWYAAFIPTKKKTNFNEYHNLSTILRSRDQHNGLFDFNPQNYNPKENKPINKKDFSSKRFLLVRENENQINYISEIIQLETEKFDKYQLRAESELKEHQEQNKTGNWKIITNEQFKDYKYSPDVGYFHKRKEQY